MIPMHKGPTLCKHLDLGSNPASHFSPSRADPPELSKFAHNIGLFPSRRSIQQFSHPAKLRLRRPERRKSAAPTPPGRLRNSKVTHHFQTLETCARSSQLICGEEGWELPFCTLSRIPEQACSCTDCFAEYQNGLLLALKSWTIFRTAPHRFQEPVGWSEHLKKLDGIAA